MGRALKLRTPAWLHLRLPLVVIGLLALAWTVLFTLRIKQYFIQPDELEYVRQAIQIGEHLRPVLPSDRAFTSWSQLQPLLMAPAWTLLSPNAAFSVQHVVNAVVMVSALIPAYLLALRVTGVRVAAYVAAALTVTVPWLTLPATMMTEVAAYPAFLWAVLGLQHAVARPSARHDLVGLAAVALAVTARPQFLVLAPALVLAAALQTLRYPPARDWRTAGGRIRALARAHLPLAIAAAVVGGGLLLALGAGGDAIHDRLIGSYSDATDDGALLPAGTLDFGREALSYVAIGIGVVPLSLALGWALGTLWRPLDAERHAYALILLAVGAGLVILVGAFSVRNTGAVNSRYLFYLAPLLFIGMLALLTERHRRTIAIAVGALLGAWLVHDAELILRGPSLVSPESAFHDVLFGRIPMLEDDLALRDFPPPRVLAFLSLIAIAAVALLRRRGRGALAAGLVVAAVGLWCVAETGYSAKRIADTQRGVSQEFLDTRSWLDDALPDGATAPVVVSSLGNPSGAIGAWWDTAFWNKQVERVFQDPAGSNFEQPFPEQYYISAEGAVLDYERPNAVPSWDPGSPYIVRGVPDLRYGIRGLQPIAEQAGIQLAQVPKPAFVDWYLRTTSDTGQLAAGADGTLTLYPLTPGTPEQRRVRLVFRAAPDALEPGRLRVSGPGISPITRTAPPKRSAEIELDVELPAGEAVELQLRAAGAPAGGVQIEAVEDERR